MTKAPDYIKMFPEAQDVFADRLEEHTKVLFPLFSIDLKQINNSWKGFLHFVDFNEDPYNVETASTFNEYCKDRMIAFDVIDNKYSFKADFKYFDLSPDWVESFEKTKENFNKEKKYYLTNGSLLPHPYMPRIPPCEQIGGEPEWMQSDDTPLDPDGNPMTFICRVNSGDKDIYLFYSDKHKLAVELYQIT